MNVKIEPRKVTDRGGYIVMPLLRDVPVPGNPEWRLVTCPGCSRNCWRRPLPAGFTKDMFDGELCTLCALRKGEGG